MTISSLYSFLAVPWVGLQRAIVVFPDCTHLLLKTPKSELFNSFEAVYF